MERAAEAARDARRYAEESGVLQLLEALTRELVLRQPAEPVSFLVEQLAAPGPVARRDEGGVAAGVTSEEEALAYLNKHRLPQLLEEVCSAALVSNPPDVRAFVADKLRLLQRGGKAGAGGASEPYYTDDDLRGMFSLFDPTGTGRISEEQARVGLRHLGIPDDKLGPVPAAAASAAQLSEDAWVSRARAALRAQRLLP